MIPRTGMLASVLLLAVFAGAQDVKTDYDRNFNFAEVHSFAVKIGTAWGNPLTEDRAKAAVAKALTARGWVQADDSTADAQVVIHGATQTKKSLDTFYSGGYYGGYGWGGFGPSTASTTVHEYKVGTMVVDIFSTKDKKLIFRGTGEDEVSNKSEKNEKKIEKAAQKMFKNFPTQPGEKK